MEIILTRRSIRKYTDGSVSDSLIEELLQAAMSAPSAGNAQPWHFIIIREKETLNSIPKFHSNAAMLQEASVAILVCADMTLEKYLGSWTQDCSAATQNILLAAHAKGLGAVWLGIYPKEERMAGIRKLLHIPAHIMPLSLVSIGYPAEAKSPSQRYRPDRIHYEVW